MSGVLPSGSSVPAAAASSSAAPSGAGSKKKKATKATGATKKKSTSRRKKATSKAAVAATNQQIWSDGAKAQQDLAQQRADAAARRADPLWYRIEDVLPAVTKDASKIMVGGDSRSSSGRLLPEQVQLVESALHLNGLDRADVTPQAMACLLEQARRYAQELVQDAQDYSYAASRAEIKRDDLILASEMRADHPTSVQAQLPKLNLIAQQVNGVPLPPIPSQCYTGVLLPPKKDQLTARTFDICLSAQTAQKMVQKAPAAPNKNKKRQSSASSRQQQPGYGAARGRQIPISLKNKQQPGGGGPTPMDTSTKD